MAQSTQPRPRRPQKRAEVVRTLSLSTRHLPVPLLGRLDEVDGVHAQRLRHGYLLTVPPLAEVSAMISPTAATVAADTIASIWLYALGQDCTLVLLDHAGPVSTELRIYHD